MSPSTQRLFPVIELDGQQYRLLVLALTTARIVSLQYPVGNLAHARGAIVAALDYLFLGF